MYLTNFNVKYLRKLYLDTCEIGVLKHLSKYILCEMDLKKRTIKIENGPDISGEAFEKLRKDIIEDYKRVSALNDTYIFKEGLR